MKQLIMVGFWHGRDRESKRYPHLHTMIDPHWDERARERVASHLERGRVLHSYLGSSQCRICGVDNGSTDLEDGVYVWPEGLAHYVREHSVRLPQPFETHALSACGAHVPWQRDDALDASQVAQKSAQRKELLRRQRTHGLSESELDLLDDLLVPYVDRFWWCGFTHYGLVPAMTWAISAIICAWCSSRLRVRQSDGQLQCVGCGVSGLGKRPDLIKARSNDDG